MSSMIDSPDVIAEVTEAHQRYERALESSNFDELDKLFWDDPRTIRYGPNGTLVGHVAISRFRRSEPENRPDVHHTICMSLRSEQISLLRTKNLSD